MTHQPSLFDNQSQPRPVDTHLDKRERQRLTGKLAAVLKQLRERPTTNIELAAIGGMRCSARVHDLRRAGFKIDAEHKGDGVWLYTLKGEPQ